MRYVYAYIGSEVQKKLEKMTLTHMFQKGIYCSAFVGVAIPYVIYPPRIQETWFTLSLCSSDTVFWW